MTLAEAFGHDRRGRAFFLEALPLPFDPVLLLARERARLAQRAPSGKSDANDSIGADGDDVASGSGVADE